MNTATPRSTRSLMLALVLGLLLTTPLLAGPPATPTTPTTPEIPDVEEDWFVLIMQGQPCGYMHSVMRPVKRSGQTEVHTNTAMQIAISRGPTTIEIKMDQTYRETLEGKPISFEHTTTMGQLPIKQTGIIRDNQIELTEEQAGVPRTNVYPFDPDVRFPWGQTLEQRKHGLKPGTTFTLKTYEPSIKTDEPVEVQFTVHDKEEVDVLGKPQKLTRLTTTLKMAIDMKTESWVDDNAKPVITTMSMGIIQFKMYKTTKEQALLDKAPPELFFSTFVQVKQPIARDAKTLKLRLRLPKDADMKLPAIPETAMQKVKRISDHEAIVTIKMLDWPKLRTTQAIDTPDDLAVYLKASTTCDAGDKRIRKLAKKAVKDKATPAEMADALRRYVTKYVTEKGLDVGFATASEVAKTKQGDCSEHAVLLAAMARAAGLPARGVSGLVRVPVAMEAGNGETLFGYHMWTQVYFGGQWVDIDAAMRQTEVDPTHIALSLMPLNDEGMMDSILSLLPVMGRLEIEALEPAR